MRIRWTAACAAAVTAAGLSACSSGSTPSGSASHLIVGVVANASTLDPKVINSEPITQSLESLLKFDSQGDLQPNLAVSVTQASPVSYVYHLRHGVTFWDGKEMTADDVAYSLNYDRAPGSQIAFSYASVKNITATDRYAVAVTLTHPDASWQYTPAEGKNSPIFEKAFAEVHKGSFGKPGVLIMGTGPWKVDSFDPTRGAELSANPHWWGGKVALRHVTYKYFASETSRAIAFRAGQIDFAPQINGQRAFASTSGAKLISAPSCDNAWFGMNTQVAPWNDVHVRRAVAYTVNRPDIIAAHGGYANPIDTLIPPQMLRSIASQAQIDALLKSIPRYPLDIGKAKQELAESAYPHGFTATITQYSDPDGMNITQTIARELSQIGIKLQIKQLATTAWQAMQTGPTSKRSTVFASGGCFNPDPSMYTDFLGSKNTQPGQWNISVYAPAVVDGFIEAGISTTDPAKRFAAYSNLFRSLQTDVPYVGLFASDSSIALSPRFTYSGFSTWYWQGTYLLGVKAKA